MLRAFYSLPWLILSLCALFWAGNAVASRLAVGEIQPFQLVLLRWLIVSIGMWAFFGHEVRASWHVLRPRIWTLVMMGGIGLTLFNAMLYLAGYQTTAVNIGILQGAMPVMVLILAFIAHRTPVTPVQILGVATTLLGVAMVASRGDLSTLLSIGLNPGDGMMLIAGAAYSIYTVMLRDRPAIPGTAFFTVMSIVALVTSIPMVVAEAYISGFSMPTVNGWLIVLYVAIFPSCLSQLFFLRGVDLIGPGRAGVYFNLVPIFAAILAILILGEAFAWYHAAALVLVLGGIALAQKGKNDGRIAAEKVQVDEG
ncbi:DMT family transporter [Rhodobacteraceae bacterium NNCM2]|nr:DMT family transporter [Coraliihabitans acroporae]